MAIDHLTKMRQNYRRAVSHRCRTGIGRLVLIAAAVQKIAGAARQKQTRCTFGTGRQCDHPSFKMLVHFLVLV